MTHADQIEAALAEHEFQGGSGWGKPTCSCDGWTTGDRFYEEIHAAHRTHVAAVLAALTPEPVAGGLSEHATSVRHDQAAREYVPDCSCGWVGSPSKAKVSAVLHVEDHLLAAHTAPALER